MSKNNSKEIKQTLKNLDVKFNGVYDYEDIANSDRMYGDLGISPTPDIMESMKQNMDMDKMDPSPSNQKDYQKLQKQYKTVAKFNKQNPHSYSFTDVDKVAKGEIPHAKDVIKGVNKFDNDEKRDLKDIQKTADQLHKNIQNDVLVDNNDYGNALENLTDKTSNFGNKYQDFKVDPSDMIGDNMVSTAGEMRDDLRGMINSDTAERPGAQARATDYAYAMKCDPDEYLEDQGNIDGVSEIQPLSSDLTDDIAQSTSNTASSEIDHIEERQKDIQKNFKQHPVQSQGIDLNVKKAPFKQSKHHVNMNKHQHKNIKEKSYQPKQQKKTRNRSQGIQR